ncbi:hypothetical protein TUBRATIS_007360 [Tubulinosema ratisbonensis]|uniref:Uncharacterized protein n=1 Tax=Tubulinosema ratisbonensis TaxID=291195 RepID=A0A437ANZ7_9MICR|nr:hypothetical protein TUBRATIS_007360 [Tubulinosema ratisbonensis]
MLCCKEECYCCDEIIYKFIIKILLLNKYRRVLKCIFYSEYDYKKEQNFINYKYFRKVNYKERLQDMYKRIMLKEPVSKYHGMKIKLNKKIGEE